MSNETNDNADTSPAGAQKAPSRKPGWTLEQVRRAIGFTAGPVPGTVTNYSRRRAVSGSGTAQGAANESQPRRGPS